MVYTKSQFLGVHFHEELVDTVDVLLKAGVKWGIAE